MPRKTAKFRVRQIVRAAGWDIVRFQAGFEELQRHLFQSERIDSLLDVGANEGQYSQRIRQLGYAGPILAFEPLPTAYARLCANFAHDAHFHAEQLGLSDRAGRHTLHVSANSVSSSLLDMNVLHQRAEPKSIYTSTEEIDVQTLDECLIPGERIWLKIDVQGAEAQVLAGATGLLSRVCIIQLELSLVPLYDGSPLIEDLIASLRGRGFALVHLAAGFCDPHSDELLQADGLFRYVAH